MTRKLMGMAVVTLLAVPALAQGQTVTATGSVSATATVAQYAQVTGATDINFGTLDRTAANTVNPAGGVGAGLRTVDYNHNIAVTYTNVPAALTANAGALSIPVSLTCAARVGAAAWSAAAACSGASFNMDVGTALTQGTLGFGGTITAAAAANAVAATYTGQLDIVVTAR